MQNNLKKVKDYQLLTNQLKKSCLVDISIKCSGTVLDLDFIRGVNDDGVLLRCLNVIHFVFSKELDENDGSYFVGDIFVRFLEDGGKEYLEKLSYGFRELDEKVIAYYPSRELLYFYIEGGVCLQVICETIQSSEQLT